METKEQKARKALSHLCAYMYMLYCDVDWVQKGRVQQMEEGYITGKFEMFLQTLESFDSIDDFRKSLGNISAVDMKDEYWFSVALWIEDYSNLPYKQKY